MCAQWAARKPIKDDLVLFFECAVLSRDGWTPDGEIAESAFLAADSLPSDPSVRTAARVADAFAGLRV